MAGEQRTQEGVRGTISDRLTQALDSNRKYLKTADTGQLRQQLANLTSQNNKLIRLLLRALDGTE